VVLIRVALAAPLALSLLSGSFPVSSTDSGGRAIGMIRGRVEFRRTPSIVPERRPGVAELGASSSPQAGEDRTRAVVYLETAPGGAFEERETSRVSMDQRNEAFVPHVLAITAGTTVEFPNSDRTYHNVFSLSKTKRFDLGRYAAGQSKAVRFDRPGIVRVFCDIHSHMNAFIVVFSHRFFALTDSDGRYRIDRVPSGAYTVVAWYEGQARESKVVTIPNEGGSVELDFMVR
jgi:plastocyanin